MNVIILCAGMGTRLLPITKNKPKCLATLKKKPLLEYQLDIFTKIKKVEKIYLAGGYKINKLKKYENYKKVKIIKISDFTKYNMLHTLVISLKKIKNLNDTLVSYGDIVYDQKILSEIINTKNSLSTLYIKNFQRIWKKRMKNYQSDLESFKINKNYFIQSIGEKYKNINELDGQYIGISKIRKNMINKIVKFYNQHEKKYNLKKRDITFFLNILIKNKFRLKALQIQNGWLEIDTYKDWKFYNSINLKKEGILKI